MRNLSTRLLLVIVALLLASCGGGSSGGDNSPATNTYYKDADGDGYSDGTYQSATSAPADHYLDSELTAISGDCDDTNPAVHPSVVEACDAVDNDCDGTVDGLAQPCYTGPGGTQDVGVCSGGTETCTEGVWGDCVGEVTPIAEVCDGFDNDCDAFSDEPEDLTPPPASLTQGVCAGAVKECAEAAWQEPNYTLIPDYESTEGVCDGIDNDCDGLLDESCSSGDCVGCHSSPQDDGDGTPASGRRAAASEFPAADTHAHFGATLDQDDCFVCHDESTHGDGNVNLFDPDGGADYSFVFPADLASDPDLSDFCMACHDADGATRLSSPANPFGDGNVPPEVASRFAGSLQWNEWYGDFCFGNEGTMRGVNSHHDISDADQAFSGAKIECLDCHNAHTVGATQPIVDPFDKTAPWLGTDNNFCISCHEGGTPLAPGMPAGVVPPTIPSRPIESCDYTTSPWWTSYTWTHSAHGLNSKRGWAGYSSAPEVELPCMSCHDPHGSYTPTNVDGNPYMIKDFVDGTPFVDDGVRFGAAWTGPPWSTFGTAQEVTVSISGVDVSWGSLCVTCHANWVNAYSWHDFCGSCQTCHGHGRDYNEADWGLAPPDDTSCAVCGNGIIDGLEECDDSNKIDGDGCSNECKIE